MRKGGVANVEVLGGRGSCLKLLGFWFFRCRASQFCIGCRDVLGTLRGRLTGFLCGSHGTLLCVCAHVCSFEEDL